MKMRMSWSWSDVPGKSGRDEAICAERWKGCDEGRCSEGGEVRRGGGEVRRG